MLIVFEVSLVALWATKKTSHNRFTYPSAIFSLIGAILFCVLSYLEHMRTIRPSFLLNTYLLFTVAFDVVRSRSYSLNADLDTIASVFSSRAGVKLVLAVLEALPKRRLLLPEFQECPPEAASGIYKRSLFWWLNGLFKTGYSGVLKVDDLFMLDKHLQSDHLHRLLTKSWTQCKSIFTS
jgi:ATP-binding cassette subfamily C (CFTR/MRP) protein 1